jgi:tetratricopeptide (TPR) repeat protein
MSEHVDVFISSTFSDLEAFRFELRNVIISLGMYPIDMVDFEPSSRNALQMCYDKLQEAEIFIGIYAHRYGYAPSSEISYKTKDGEVKTGDGETGITHWEYLWAQEKGIPCLLFLLDEENVAWLPKFMDKGKQAESLTSFKNHLKANHVVNFFSDKDDLSKKALLGLAKTMPKYVEAAPFSWRALRAPEPPYYFAGRAKETNELFERLARSKTVLMTGMGGTGKTTLARHIGKQSESTYGGGVLWLQLNPEVTKALDAQRRAIAAWKEAHPQSRESNAEISPEDLKRLLSDSPKPLLAILDDAWSSEVITGIRACLPEGTPLLITTRNVNLATPRTGERYELTQLSPEDALSFLSQRLNLNGAHAPDLQEIGKLLGHHALALELVAAWLERESLSDMPALKNKLRHPKGLFRTLKMGDSRDENLEKALALSYLPLEENETETAKAFRLLSAMPSGLDFTPELAFAVWETDADDEESQNEADETLRQLTRVGLLERRSTGRYFLHQTLHAYASKLIEDKGEKEALQEAAERYHAKLTELAHGFFDLPMQDWLSKLEEPYLPHFFQRANELLALDIETAAEEKVKEASDFFNNIRYLAVYRPQYHLLAWLEKGLAASKKLEQPSSEALFLGELGFYYQNRGQLGKALNYFEQALILRREQTNRREEGTLLNNIGMIYKARGELDKALETYQKVLTLVREIGEKYGEGVTINNIGMIYKARGELDKALEYYLQDLAITREVGDRRGEGTTLNNIGSIYQARGELDKALESYQQALAINREVGDRRGEGTTLNNIGSIYQARGELDKALESYQQALAINREVGDKAGEGITLWNMGLLYISTGDLDKAIEHIEACVIIEREIQHPDYESDKAYLEDLKRQRDAGK